MTSGASNDRSNAQNLIDFDDPLQHEHVERDEGTDAGVQLGGGSAELPVDLFSAPSPGPSAANAVATQSQPSQFTSPTTNLNSNDALKSLYAMGPSMNTPVSYSQPFTPTAATPITPGMGTPVNIANTSTPPIQSQPPQPQPQPTQQPQQPQQKSPFDDLVDLMK